MTLIHIRFLIDLSSFKSDFGLMCECSQMTHDWSIHYDNISNVVINSKIFLENTSANKLTLWLPGDLYVSLYNKMSDNRMVSNFATVNNVLLSYSVFYITCWCHRTSNEYITLAMKEKHIYIYISVERITNCDNIAQVILLSGNVFFSNYKYLT